MNIFDFLEPLQSLDIHVSAENGKLRVNAPKEAITPEIRSELVARKDEIISVFSALDSIPLERRNGPLPLSLAQENLWQLPEQARIGTPQRMARLRAAGNGGPASG